MKKTVAALALSCATLLCVVNLSACAGKSKELAAPKAAEPLSYSETVTDGMKNLRDSVDAFSSNFSAAAYSHYEGAENFTVSPVTAYMALTLAAVCAGGDTRAELLSALNTSYAALEADYGNFYRSLAARISGSGMGQLKLAGSIWLNEGTSFKQNCVDLLAEKFYGYSYAADFARDNKNANLAVKDFVKKQTNGLIDKNFRLPADTLFTIVSALYLKDTWNLYGNNLPFTSEPYDFLTVDGQTKSTKLLEGYYSRGRVYEGETFTHFFTATHHNFKLKFIVPKDGYTVADVFTAETIAEVNGVSDYNADDDVNMIHYYTRCLFPEYSASFDGEMQATLEDLGVKALFDPAVCDFSSLTDGGVVCGEVRHAAKLTVNRKGIEGAAVFVIPGAGAAGPDGYEEVYEDFVVGKSFAFILTDSYNVPLFTGVIGDI